MQNRFIKSPEEIDIIAEGGRIMREILTMLGVQAKSGVSTYQLNELAHEAILKAGGRPSFLGYGSKKNPFPATICTSLNSQVVHGIPSTRVILKNGDILGIDIGMEYKGLYTDTAITVIIGQVKPEASKLVQTTKTALENALKVVKAGNRIGDISHAIQSTAEKVGFSVVRELVGHGVGYEVHEDPAIPCYGTRGTGLVLEEGMVLAIEPMVCQYKPAIFLEKDGWTISTQDDGLSAHFEHTIAVTKNGHRLLT